MPNLNSLPITKYKALHPYHHYYDNLPINDIEKQIQIVNYQVDYNQIAILDSIGNSGTLANRLSRSLLDNGELKSSAIDIALHNISEHMDGGGYVRMTDIERAKLGLIQDEATNLSIAIDSISNTSITWPSASETFTLQDSETINWRVDNDFKVAADINIPTGCLTLNFYDVIPLSSDKINFSITSSGLGYKGGTLRVYINGFRIPKTPNPIEGYYFTEVDSVNGLFKLNTSLSTGDIIRIDFDRDVYEASSCEIQGFGSLIDKIFISPDGTYWRISVDNDGTLSTDVFTGADVYFADVVLQAPNGDVYKVSVNNDGNIISTLV